MYEKIDKLCKSRGISVCEMEIILGLSKGSVNKWRSHMPRADRLCKVALFLGTTSEYLLSGQQ